MKGKNMVLLALAVGCGLVAAFLTAKLGAGNKTEMVPVLVAARNLDQGTKLDKIEEMFVRKPFPRESVPPEFIDDVTSLKDKVLQRSLRAGSHLTMGDITPRGGIELPVDPKTGIPYKAMGLKVAPETVVGGLVLPGSRVDVASVERQQSGKTVAAMILQNVLVVAVDVTAVRPEDNGYIKNAQTVTLAVKQQEGLVLALAQKRGDVFLLLRDPKDPTINKNLRNVTDLFGGDRGADSSTPNTGTSEDPVVPVEKNRILVAKELVPAGTKITDPDKYFQETDWSGTVPPNFLVRTDDLRGRVVTMAIPPNSAPTREAFEEAGRSGPAPVFARDTSKRHTMTIQIGGAPAWHAHYKDGKLDNNAGRPPAPAPTPAGSTEINEPGKTDAPIN